MLTVEWKTYRSKWNTFSLVLRVVLSEFPTLPLPAIHAIKPRGVRIFGISCRASPTRNRILKQAKSPLKDGAAVNSTRWALFNALKATGLPVTTGTGGQTQFNRTRLGLPKMHWLDAACVGDVERIDLCITRPLLIAAKGHGTRQMCGTNKYGFPVRHRSRVQVHKGFQTGDIVSATVTAGKKAGSYVGRVLCRASGSFDLVTSDGRVAGVSHKYCKQVHQKDGYSYG